MEELEDRRSSRRLEMQPGVGDGPIALLWEVGLDRQRIVFAELEPCDCFSLAPP